MVIAHRRAVDRVRSEQRSAERELRAASHAVAYDEVAEKAEANLDRERVRRCLGSLTDLQREAVTLAYYGGYTYRQVAGLLGSRRRHGEHPDARWPDPAAGLPRSAAMRTRRPEPHTLAGAYALDALTGTDRARFERHLARCQQCAHEIGGLWEATARLAAAAATEPPPRLTERALTAAAQTRQLPPATRQTPARWPAGTRPLPDPGRRRAARAPAACSGGPGRRGWH